MDPTAKEWVVTHEGHELRVRNSWFSGASLFVDGVLASHDEALFELDSSRPVLACEVAWEGRTARVEVYLVAILTTRAAICVDGVPVGGDLHALPPRQRVPAVAHYRTASVGIDPVAFGAIQRALVNADNLASLVAVVVLGLALAGSLWFITR